MNLRPMLAADFADAILKDLRGRRGVLDGIDNDIQVEMRSDWETLILDRFKSYSIEYQDNTDPEALKAFLAKYPQLQRLIDLARGEATRRFDPVSLTLEMGNEYESCHTCGEGQYLILRIQTELEFYGDDGELEGSEYDRANDAWVDWLCDGGTPWRHLAEELGEVAGLLRTNIQWKPEPDE